jgi:alanyl aminopeptidase
MRTTRSSFFLACILVTTGLLLGCSPDRETAQPEATDPGPAPLGRLGTDVRPEHYRLQLRIDPREERFSGTTAIDITITRPVDRIWLHGKGLEMDEAYLADSAGNRVNAKFEQRDDTGVALVSLDEPVPAGKATLHFSYSAPFNTAANALFRVEREDKFYVASQFEPIAARQVFPGFDEPAFKVPFDLELITRDGDVAITTTPDIAAESLGDGYVRHTYETTRPMPTYLLAFAVGPYDVVNYGSIPPNAIRHHELPLRAIVAQGLASRVDYALEHTDGLLTVLEEYFGTPYPYRKLDLIAVPESFGGAMENIGAIIYDEFLLLLDDDSPLTQRRAYTVVHAHEMAHMWFGNLVTPEWWNDIWLNEAFATWMAYKAADQYWPDGEFDRSTLTRALDAMQQDSLAAARQIREPVDHSKEISSAFDSITYSKGGGVLAMLERYIGDEEFRDGVRLHMARHSDSTATAEQFIESLAEGSDRTEIEAAFKSFTERPGVPLLTVRLECPEDGSPALAVNQERYAPLGSTIDRNAKPWQVPMCIRFDTDDGTESTCTLLRDKTQTVALGAENCPTWVHPNADGSGYYRFSMDDQGWQSLAANVTGLSAAEALVFVDSLDAALRAGTVSAENYAQGMAALLHHDAWDVIDAVARNLEELAFVVEHTKLERLEAAYRRLVRPVFARINESTDTGSVLLRESLLKFLVVIARDPEIREPLARQAAARIGLDGEPDPDAAPPGELEAIFTVGVQDIGAPFFDLLLEQTINSRDPAFRYAATGALANVEDPELVAKLQTAILDGQFKGAEAVAMVSRQMLRDATTDLTYEWLRANDDALLPMVPETFRSSRFPSLGKAFCSTERADDWQAYIDSHAADLPGYERNLAQAIEAINLCAALREASQNALIAAFAAVDPR